MNPYLDPYYGTIYFSSTQPWDVILCICLFFFILLRQDLLIASGQLHTHYIEYCLVSKSQSSSLSLLGASVTGVRHHWWLGFFLNTICIPWPMSIPDSGTVVGTLTYLLLWDEKQTQKLTPHPRFHFPPLPGLVELSLTPSLEDKRTNIKR